LVSRITAISFDTSDLVPVTAPETEDEARLRVARNAYYAANLRAGVPEERALFRRMLGDGPAKGDFDLDNGFQITASGQTRGVSSCALVGGEILKMSGLQVPWAGKSYKFGTAVSRIYAWAQSAGIWYPGNVLPEMGDLVIIGTGLREHVAIWISVYDNLSTKGDVVWTVDGGQVDRYHKGKNGVGMQKIAHVGRDLTIKAGGTYWLGDRPLLGSASLAKCFAKGLFGSGVEARRMEATA
jgi:hypothetical protein